jgi:DNA-binding transcriptional LysR family regulator
VPADLNDTMVFVKVVEAGSFTAAAFAMGLPKTTVSRKIRELEQRLGAQLLHRTTRRLSLTEAGSAYFEHCEKIARTLIEAEAAVGQLQGEPRGTLRITASYSVIVSLIAPLLGEFRTHYPEVRVDLILSHQVLDLVEKEIDVALRMGPLCDSSMVARRLAVLPNHVYASENYLAQHGEPRHPKELRQHLALATRVAQRGRSHAWPMSDGGGLQDFEINPVVVADDPEVLKDALFSGAGLMMATDMIMGRHVAEGLVQPVLPNWVGRCPELSAVFPHGHVQPPKLRAFVNFLLRKLEFRSTVLTPNAFPAKAPARIPSSDAGRPIVLGDQP